MTIRKTKIRPTQGQLVYNYKHTQYSKKCGSISTQPILILERHSQDNDKVLDKTLMLFKLWSIINN